MPWQQHVLDVAFELGPDGTLWYGEVDNLAPRQNGKTALTTPVAAHRLTAMARMLGPQTLTFTMQHRAKARKKLEREFAESLRGSRSFKEITNPKARPRRPTEWKLALNNGSEHIRIGRSYWQIDAPSRTGTHGDTLDVGMIDEAFAHQDDAVELAMSPAMATRTSPQLWVYSTAGDRRSYYLWRKVLAGRRAHEAFLAGDVEAHDRDRVAYFEWSAPDDADPGDPATWWLAMPALGFTITEDFVAREWAKAQRGGPEGIATFRRSYLNQWPEVPVLEETGDSVFDPADWNHVCDPDLRQPSSGLVFALDVNPERSAATIGVAGDGGVCGIAERRAGTGWAIDETVRICKRHRARVAIAARSPAAALIAAIEREGVDVVSVPQAEMPDACAWFYDAVVEHSIRIRRDADLDAAAQVAMKKPSGDSFVWARRIVGDVSPLVAVTLAGYIAARDGAIDMAGQIW